MDKKSFINKQFKWNYLDNVDITDIYDMPKIKAVNNLFPRNLVDFSNAKYCKERDNSWFHFYTYDSKFNHFWNDPGKYLKMLSQFEGGISPDYSIYIDMPYPQQVYNSWRNKVSTCILQECGINVIPNVGWGGEETFDWAFDGIPENSMLAVTSQGCMKDSMCMRTFVNGIHELIRQKHPTDLVVYGNFKEEWYDKFDVNIIRISSYSEFRWRNKDGQR